jgi:RHS repeat-associated protein
VRYSWDPAAPLPTLAVERSGTGSLLRRFLTGPSGPLALTTPGGTSYYHHDALGSTVALTSSSGALQLSYNYEPFGATRPTGTRRTSGGPANPLAFTGAYQQGDGTYFLHARNLDPTTGRFNGLDPVSSIESKPSVSPYTYVENMPTRSIDPTGEIVMSICLGGNIGLGHFSGGLQGCINNDGGAFSVTEVRTGQLTISAEPSFGGGISEGYTSSNSVDTLDDEVSGTIGGSVPTPIGSFGVDANAGSSGFDGGSVSWGTPGLPEGHVGGSRARTLAKWDYSRYVDPIFYGIYERWHSFRSPPRRQAVSHYAGGGGGGGGGCAW